MKTNEAPKKIYIPTLLAANTVRYKEEGSIEYVLADAFIEKACEFWKDHLAGYDICGNDIERSVESFKLAMEL